jgi:hypothetical protein
MPSSSIDISTLTEFALGKLSPETSAKLIRLLERNPRLSKDLEAVLTLIEYLENAQDPAHAETSRSGPDPQPLP